MFAVAVNTGGVRLQRFSTCARQMIFGTLQALYWHVAIGSDVPPLLASVALDYLFLVNVPFKSYLAVTYTADFLL